MTSIKIITGTAIPLTGNDIDTDRIIPARFLRCVTFDGLGTQVFADDRAQQKGQHPFDLPQFQQANILIVNNNFGCGSSREHAPQAIAKWGIKAIIGESFAEIFLGNCIAIGIPCLTANSKTIKQIQQIITQQPDLPIELDLITQQLKSTSQIWPLDIPQSLKNMLITGTWDTCSQLMDYLDQVQITANTLPYLNWS